VARRKLERAVDGFDVKRSHCHLVEGGRNEAIPLAARRERSAIVAMGSCHARASSGFSSATPRSSSWMRSPADILVVKPPILLSACHARDVGVQILSMQFFRVTATVSRGARG
jgi:hypothetical protein